MSSAIVEGIDFICEMIYGHAGRMLADDSYQISYWRVVDGFFELTVAFAWLFIVFFQYAGGILSGSRRPAQM